MAKGCKCIGVAPYSFKPNDRNETLTGYTFWFVEQRKGCAGEIPFKASFSDSKFDDLCVDLGFVQPSDFVSHFFELSYNRYGKVASLVFSE